MRCISTHKWIWSRLCGRRVMRRHTPLRSQQTWHGHVDFVQDIDVPFPTYGIIPSLRFFLQSVWKKYITYSDANGISRSTNVFSGTWAKWHNSLFCPKKEILLKLTFYRRYFTKFVRPFTITKITRFPCVIDVKRQRPKPITRAASAVLSCKAPVTPNGDATVFVQRSENLSARCGVAAKHA